MYEPTRQPYPGRFFWFALAALSMAFAALSVVGCSSHGPLAGADTDRGLVLTVGDVLFAPDKAEVGPGAQRSIDKLAEFLRAYPKRNVLIEGHTDNLGNEDFNIRLSRQRADTVRDLLAARGVSPQRIRTKEHGPKFPVVENDSAAGRQQNRRVEVLVLNEGVSAEGSTR